MVLEYRKRSGIAMNEVIIQAQDLVKIYKSKKGIFSSRKEEVKALDHVSFEIKKGQIVGLIGESGCGKTTVGKALLNLLPVDGGKVIFQGKCIYDIIRCAVIRKWNSFADICRLFFKIRRLV